MSPQTAVSTDDFASRGIDGVPLCTDSTFDNEEEMLFQLKPQAMFEGEKKIADSQGWHAMQQEEEKKTDDDEKFPLELV